MNSKAPVYRIVFVQLAVSVLAAISLIFVDIEKAYSILLGGLTCVLPSWFMAWRMGRESADPSTALKYLVRGEMGKLLLTAVIFSAVFLWVKPLNAAYYFMALVAVMLFNIFVPLFDIYRNSNRNGQEAIDE